MRRSQSYIIAAVVSMAMASPLEANGPRQQSAAVESTSVEAAVIAQYCLGCHNDRARVAGLALDTVDPTNVGPDAAVWEKVVRKLRARTMPPIGQARPDAATYDRFASSLEASLDQVSATHPNPGRGETFNRLNRAEYRNAIRDLLSLEVDVDSLLPKDEPTHGFDNVAVAGLSSTLIERYLGAAKKISGLAVGSPPLSPASSVIRVPADRTQSDHVEGLPFGTRGGVVFDHIFRRDGEYDIEVRLTRNNDGDLEGLNEPHLVELTLNGNRIQTFTIFKPTSPAEQATAGIFTVRIPVKAGSHAVGASFIKRPSSLTEGIRQPSLAQFGQRHPRLQPAVYSVSVVGPFNPTGAGDTASRRRIFTCRPSAPSEEADCARTILSTLARRAYRRPVTEVDLQASIAFYEEGRVEGGFEAGIEMALRALLVSPDFLFRIEGDPASSASGESYRIGDLELASRLSFFLWSSIPDDELLDVAIAGTLSDPETLEHQVRRMLSDPRAEALVENFAEQWLYLRNLPVTVPDPRRFLDFDDDLRQAFKRETDLFFESIVREDRSILDLLGARYTFVNERLARHYAIPNVNGSHFRKVEFTADDARGGLLGHGSILTVTSYANRTSPVLRGKWILENILGTTPPLPPPDVPALEDSDADGKVLSMRDRMVAHRANPACASCHRLMDPIGLSAENFDAIGRWRANGEDGAPIDASGSLPDGTTFEGVAGLRQALLARPDLFVTTVAEKMLTYALGRGLEHYDAPAVRKIVKDAKRSDYSFSSTVLGIVRSVPMQMRRSE